MNTIQESRFIRALLKQPTDKTPIWIMRQAGRYLPEYRKIRSSVGGFMELCKNPELACEVTLQPLRRFELDAAILFSDILTIPDAMDLGLYFAEGEGPKFTNPIKNIQDIENLIIPEPEEKLSYVTDTIKLIKQNVTNKPLIGFAGSPWTLACYIVEGGTSKQFQQIKTLMYAEPDSLDLLLEKLALSTIKYLNAQIHAGVNAIMIFDTWGGILSPDHYEYFSLKYMRQIINGLDKNYQDQTIPVVLFTKNGGQWLPKIAASGCNAVGIDWTKNIAQARAEISNTVALQGNLDPLTLFAKPEIIKQEAKKILDAMHGEPGFVFNLGHGILPQTNPDHVKCLVDFVHEYNG